VARFKLVGRAEGDAKLMVHAFKGGSGLGTVIVTTRVVKHAADGPAAEGWTKLRPGPRVPDLSLLVFEDKQERSYHMRLSAHAQGVNFAPFGPIRLNEGVDQFFSAFYRDLEAILASTDTAKEKAERLSRHGAYLFEKVAPPELRQQLWALRGQLASFEIQSEEPWIPWEVCRLVGEEDGAIVEGNFLCEEFRVTRWLLGLPQHMELSMESIGVVAPAGAGLGAAPAELAFILGLAAPGVRDVTRVPARAGELREALAAARHTGIHFVGHGNFVTVDADRSALQLENGAALGPADLSGRVGNLRKKRPLVFLNACEVGQGGQSLVGMGGWAQAFLKAGAGAFIGPYWKVSDVSASTFAQTFYRQLLDSKSVGEAVHAARQAIKQANDPTWLAYTVYAHPDARVVAPVV
jgi:hypothetical protein